MTATISYKVKPFIVDCDGTERQAVRFKKTVSRADCSLRPHEHDFYNSDLFPRMLQRQYEKIKGEYRDWSYLDDLPPGFSVNGPIGFFVTLVCELPDNFR